MEWDRVCRCERCERSARCVFKPADFSVPPRGAWICAECDPQEHADYFAGLALFGAEELGRKPE